MIDGRDLLGPDEVAALYDGVHPDAAAHQRMGERFATHPTIADAIRRIAQG